MSGASFAPCHLSLWCIGRTRHKPITHIAPLPIRGFQFLQMLSLEGLKTEALAKLSYCMNISHTKVSVGLCPVVDWLLMNKKAWHCLGKVFGKSLPPHLVRIHYKDRAALTIRLGVP
ncbi:hypothetical protein THIOM_005332 [Candidatus Thiomargarita nelsonii]|uniref:Uncharacterized protein n=1 Tax=Candidatus Thiomargarita nelsonii TaxID=1003181 RepID=A0A176RTI5_9GAMM|nr:hypothetical protein THIOM_005332 [Candidatus Thiomargarita nelsonii]